MSGMLRREHTDARRFIHMKKWIAKKQQKMIWKVEAIKRLKGNVVDPSHSLERAKAGKHFPLQKEEILFKFWTHVQKKTKRRKGDRNIYSKIAILDYETDDDSMNDDEGGDDTMQAF